MSFAQSLVLPKRAALSRKKYMRQLHIITKTRVMLLTKTIHSCNLPVQQYPETFTVELLNSEKPW